MEDEERLGLNQENWEREGGGLNIEILSRFKCQVPEHWHISLSVTVPTAVRGINK